MERFAESVFLKGMSQCFSKPSPWETDSCIERLKIIQTTQFLPDPWYPGMSILRREVAMIPQILRYRYHPKVLMHAWQYLSAQVVK